ncbi:hypothetical protein VTI74DRAFT_2823 [Chaetomium olivicolor]
MAPLIRYNLAPTLNGLVASLPSHSHAWIVPDPTIDFAALFAEFSHFLMGRKTYETFLSLPEGENLLAGRPREAVVVFTRDESKVKEWGEKVTVVREDVVGFVRGLKKKAGPEGGEEAKGKDIWIMGGGELAGMLLRAGLVDVVEAAIMPVIVGKGVPMFGEGRGEGDTGEQGWKLQLEDVNRKESGILMTRYRVLYD